MGSMGLTKRDSKLYGDKIQSNWLSVGEKKKYFWPYILYHVIRNYHLKATHKLKLITLGIARFE